jgi:hypothetical protein
MGDDNCVTNLMKKPEGRSQLGRLVIGRMDDINVDIKGNV